MPNYSVTAGEDGIEDLVLSAASEAIVAYTASYPDHITVEVTAGGTVYAMVGGRPAGEGTAIANGATVTFDARTAATPIVVRLISADGSTVTVTGYVGDTDRLVGTFSDPYVPPVSGGQDADADLTVIAGLTATTNNVIQSVSSAWASRTPAQLKATLALAKGDVGLGNVDNTADTAKPVSTAAQTALDGKQPLDTDLTTIAGLTATTDNIIQSVAGAWASRTMAQVKTALGLTKGDVGLGNVDNVQQQPIDSDLTTIAGLTATTDNVIQSVAGAWASRTMAQLKTALALAKGDVGLGNVDNTADTAKPVSSATTTAINAVKPDVQIFTADGTWTKPAGCTRVQVAGLGAGGGGGAGARLASGTASSGGGGGAGAGYSSQVFRAADLSATEAVVIGSGGAGGAAQTANDTNGATGTSGLTTTFGTAPNIRLRIGAGGGGTGGNTGTAAAGTVTGALTNGLAGGAGNAGAAGTTASGASFASGGGGGGGGISATPTATTGGGAGAHNATAVAAIAATAVNANGVNGASATANTPSGAQGAPGGGASITGVGGNGGTGGLYGGGGGGGGSSLNGFNSGAGGTGGGGILIVISD